MASEDYIDLCYDIESDYSGQYDGPTNDLEAWEDKHRGCSGARIIRTNKSTGELFWGCSKFPACRITVPLRDGQ